MTNIENEFFEEYKRLDRLCRDLLKSENGVTEYIAQMDAVPYISRYDITSWDSDYKALKHARWIRNKIAHGDGFSECTEQDFTFVVGFYCRIINQDDPFSQLRRRNERRRNEKRKKDIPFINSYQMTSPTYTSYAPPRADSTDTPYQDFERDYVPKKKNTVAIIVLILLMIAFLISLYKIYVLQF